MNLLSENKSLIYSLFQILIYWHYQKCGTQIFKFLGQNTLNLFDVKTRGCQASKSLFCYNLEGNCLLV